MGAYLIYPGTLGEERIPCGSVTTIGRDRNSDIVLPELLVSRNHAMLRRLGEADFYLIDSGSSNGSLLNGRQVAVPTLLCNGDRITIGNTEFVFEQESHAVDFTDSLSFQATMISDAPLIKEITIFVADIRGFTSLSERLPIRTLTKIMNEWFNEVSDAIYQEHGAVDKFIGDCVFARWESDDTRKNVTSALRAACLLRDITTGLNGRYSELDETLRLGVGINTGMASLGVGSENTALGDAVNTAFRLESASKELGKDIVLSESSYTLLPEQCWRNREQPVKLKGKRKPVNVIGFGFDEVQRLLSAGS